MKRVLLFTGEGKGKTTAALGTVLRAAGHGQKCLIIQFVKADSRTGELAACSVLPGVEIRQMGMGFAPAPSHPHFRDHCTAALDAMAFAARALGSGAYDLVMLDEICVAVDRQLIDEAGVLDLLEMETTASCLILTGRGAGPRLMGAADTVTEMRCVKHALQHGGTAQQGVEF